LAFFALAFALDLAFALAKAASTAAAICSSMLAPELVAPELVPCFPPPVNRSTPCGCVSTLDGWLGGGGWVEVVG
jgi:hypothetical protein